MMRLIQTLWPLIFFIACNGDGGKIENAYNTETSGPGVSTPTPDEAPSPSPTPIPPSSPLKKDPLIPYAWHLENIGQRVFANDKGVQGIDLNLKDIPSYLDGSGVTIAISDTGIETNHEDLSANYLPGISKNFLLASPFDGDPIQNGDAHGTAVTGIMAAEGFNNIGSRGIASQAQFGGFNFLIGSQSMETRLYQMDGPFDIFNYSYGKPSCRYSPIFSSALGKKLIIDGYKNGVETLRSGKGAIYVKSAGNDFHSSFARRCVHNRPEWSSTFLGNAVFDEMNNLPYLIIVGAVNAKGEKSSYSSPGPNLWISGLGGEYGDTDPAIVTTDLSGCAAGYSQKGNQRNVFESGAFPLNKNCNYTSIMNGTSAAAPTVSGVIALILQANPELSWRDVKHILASTATIIDPSSQVYSHPLERDLVGHTYQEGWVQNDAGYFFHNYYGFGLINAKAAIDMALSYAVDLGELTETTYEEGNWIYQSALLNQVIPDESAMGISHTIEVKHNFIIEAVQIKVFIGHAYAENIGIELTSPKGTKSIITNINSNIIDEHIFDHLFLSNAFYGEESQGHWTIKVIDGSHIHPDGSNTNTTGILFDWSINIIGHKPINPLDETPPEAVASITHPLTSSSLTTSPIISFSASDSVDVLRYEVSLGTVAGATDISDWRVANADLTYLFTDLELEGGRTYFVNVRVIDTSENISEVTSSDGWTAGTP